MSGKLQERTKRDEAEATDRRLRLSGLPTLYAQRKRTLAVLPAAANDSIVAVEALGKTTRGVYLWGEAGSFKTSVAAAFLAREIIDGATGRYVFVPDLFTDLYAIYAAGDSRSRADIVDSLIEVPCLVLDDLGKEKASDHASSVLFEIIDGRYRHQTQGRWTIVTSNRSPELLCARFTDDTGEPIARRLSEMCVSVPMKREAV